MLLFHMRSPVVTVMCVFQGCVFPIHIYRDTYFSSRAHSYIALDNSLLATSHNDVHVHVSQGNGCVSSEISLNFTSLPDFEPHTVEVLWRFCKRVYRVYGKYTVAIT